MQSTPYPLVLVGFGDFGLKVLRDYLAQGALDGDFEWADPAAGQSPAARTIRGQAYLHIPNVREAQRPMDSEPGRVLRDTWNQIEEVDPSVEQGVDAVLEQLARRLLKGSHQPIGLDLVVLAAPREDADCGELKHELRKAIARLSKLPFLKPKAEGSASRLRAVQLLDVSDLSGDNLNNYADFWKATAPGHFSRLFLLTKDADPPRDPDQRREETVLFLRLLATPRRADSDEGLSSIFDPVAGGMLAAFGLRVFETGETRLRRLVAAEVGVRFLEYLSGTAPPELETDESLASWLEEHVGDLDGDAIARDVLGSADAEVRERLFAVPFGPGWVDGVFDQLAEVERDLVGTATAKAKEMLESVKGEELGNALQRHLEKLLQGEGAIPIESAIQQAKTALALLDGRTASGDPTPGTSKLRERLQSLESEFLEYLRDQLDPSGFWKTWTGLTIATACLGAPLVRALLPSTAGGGVSIGHSAVASAIAVGVGVILWPVGMNYLVRDRIKRDTDVWTDPTQGRLAHELDQALSEHGELRTYLLHSLRLAVRAERAQAVSAVRRRLVVARDRLTSRRGEVLWLKSELQRYRQRCAAAPTSFLVESHDIDQRLADLRAAYVDQASEYRSLQHSQSALEGWSDAFSDRFVYPIVWLDRFADGLSWNRATQSDVVAKTLLDFIKRHARFAPAFSFGAPGLHTTHVASLPKHWATQDVTAALDADMGVQPVHVHRDERGDTERAVVLATQLHVAQDALDLQP